MSAKLYGWLPYSYDTSNKARYVTPASQLVLFLLFLVPYFSSCKSFLSPAPLCSSLNSWEWRLPASWSVKSSLLQQSSLIILTVLKAHTLQPLAFLQNPLLPGRSLLHATYTRHHVRCSGDTPKWRRHVSSDLKSLLLIISSFLIDLEHKGFWQQFTFQIIFCWIGLANRNDTTHWRITYIFVITKLFLSIPTAMKTLSGGFVFTPWPWDETLNYYNLGTRFLMS